MLSSCLVAVFLLLLPSASGWDIHERRRAANSRVCYPVVGCFSNAAPFNNALHDLPASPSKIGTEFRLYTRRLNSPVLLSYVDHGPTMRSTYDGNLPTKFIIHGFAQGGDADWVILMKETFLSYIDCNIIVVDWVKGAALPDYPTAVANTRLVGVQLAKLIATLISVGASREQVHLIGHSLGAQTAGYAGSYYNGTLGRITGLDPAGPLYSGNGLLVRLDSTDAQFVDAIHTNAAGVIHGGAGIFDRSGDVDFYPNGGKVQPGCPPQVSGTLEELFNFNSTAAANDVSCSHSRSHNIYIESINIECQFTAVSCSDYEAFSTGSCPTCNSSPCNEMGYHASSKLGQGQMFLKTRPQPPFCGNEYMISIYMSLSMDDTVGTVFITFQGRRGKTDALTVSKTNQNMLSGDVVKGVVVILPLKIGKLTRLVITYKRKHASMFSWSSGGTAIKINRVTLTKVASGKTSSFGGFFEEDRSDAYQTLVSDQIEDSPFIG